MTKRQKTPKGDTTGRRASHRSTTAVVAERRPPWWLTAGSEICVVCHQGYAFGTEYRCAGCDEAVCVFCIQDRDGEFFCPEC